VSRRDADRTGAKILRMECRLDVREYGLETAAADDAAPARREGRARRRAVPIGVILVAALAACGGGSSGQGSGHSSNDLDLQAARMAAIGGCQAVSTAFSAPAASGASAAQLQAIQNAFNNTSGSTYPGVDPLLRTLLAASTPVAATRAVGDLQRWCLRQGFAPQR
jgi:hypothetical protein